MVWTSWPQFFAMGGYGVYVWGSFIVCLSCICIEGVLLRMAQTRALKQIRRRQQLRHLQNNTTEVHLGRISAGVQE